MASFMTKMIAGMKAFREGYVSAGADSAGSFADPDGRRLRYAINWAFFENTVYRDIHTWSTKYRTDFALYKHIRAIYNPSYRLGEFWATHLLGGALDADAGDGTKPSALPIQLGEGVKNRQGKALRAAIARVWRDSNWQTNKSVWTRFGAVLGDAPLMIVDDTVRRKVYIKVLHPGLISALDRDPFGNVKGYTIEEKRPNPKGGTQAVTYKEVATRDGDNVVYQTFLNDAAYAWNGVAAEWNETYGFVPLIAQQHLNVGGDWGWSELHAGVAKIREVDDLASNLHDQIRKMVNAPWLFAGVENPKDTVRTRSTPVTAQRTAPGREELPALYTKDASARAQPLVSPLSIGETSGAIGEVLKELERDYPELQMDIWGSGDVSGRALRVARQRSESKVQLRRAGYDANLVKAQQMCIAIGGMQGYDGYQGFNLDSYAAGQLDHMIIERPVFSNDPMDDLDERSSFWATALNAYKAGAPLASYLEDAGWDDQRIARFEARKEQESAAAMERARAAGLPVGNQESGSQTENTVPN